MSRIERSGVSFMGPVIKDPVAWFLTAVLLIVLLALPLQSRADYLITHGQTTIRTGCYWIQQSKVYLCEGGEPLALSGVSSIEAGTMTPLDNDMHRDTLRRFFGNLAWILDREEEIVESDKALADGLREVEALLQQPGKKKELKALKKRLLGDIETLRQSVVGLERSWKAIRIPQRSLVQVSEIKSLQFLTWLQSLEEWEIFLETDDPTFREYAMEHGRQTAQFRELLALRSPALYGDAIYGDSLHNSESE
ncbi:MAG: hypothetical protein MUD15_09490 [Desulfobacterota bacterium]|nr:hypothetical protein [Thermodesulfobacteriota bacterium]